MKIMLPFILTLLASCASPAKIPTEAKALDRLKTFEADSRAQVNSLLSMIDEQARFINSNEIHYIPYEFQIPLDAHKRKAIHRIDSSVSFIKRKEFYQCIGENATRELIFQIMALPYTKRIKFCPYE